jgi:hypothetical protein
VADQYQLYCITPRLPQQSKQRPIDWWKEESHQEAHPDLSRWAIDRLLPETVQALECIKSWTLQKIGNEGITEHRQLDEDVM